MYSCVGTTNVIRLPRLTRMLAVNKVVFVFLLLDTKCFSVGRSLRPKNYVTRLQRDIYERRVFPGHALVDTDVDNYVDLNRLFAPNSFPLVINSPWPVFPSLAHQGTSINDEKWFPPPAKQQINKKMDQLNATAIRLFIDTFNKFTTGKRNPERIVGGTDAKRGAYPFMAAYIMQEPDRPSYIEMCGGTLIDRIHILTAAHCLFGPKGLKQSVVGTLVGLNTTQPGEPSDGFIVRSVKGFFIHPGYAGFHTTDFDIAVLVLNSPVDGIAPVRLPLDPAMEVSYGPKTGVAIGWGDANPTGGDDAMNTVLLEAKLRIMNHYECSNFLGNPIKYYQFCTSNAHGRAPCRGDSGGPLLLNGVQVGIISYVASRLPWVQKCADPNDVAVFVRVSSFLDWIYYVTTFMNYKESLHHI